MYDACLKMLCCVHFLYYNYDTVLTTTKIKKMGTTCTDWWILGVSVMIMVVILNKFVQVCVGWQVLVTKPDFQNEFSRTNLRSTLGELCKLKIVPIINANDAVAPPPEPDKDLAGVRALVDTKCCCLWGGGGGGVIADDVQILMLWLV